VMNSLLAIGAKIANRYEVVKYVNEGGMQQVFHARDLHLNRDVALKVPKVKSASRRFDRSAKLSARVVHPNVAATLDYIESGDDSYLVEELFEGDNLGDRFKRDFYCLDPHLAAHVLHHLAKGVSAAHHVGVVHRDLKPTNVMVSSDFNFESIKITDFGVAKMAEEEIKSGVMGIKEGDENSLTGSQTLVGAIPYMAPERFSTPQISKKASDIWALGAMAYYFLTGKLPYGRGFEAMARIQSGQLPAKPEYFGLCSQLKVLEESLWELIQRCFTMDPESRPTADELVMSCGELCYSREKREVGKVKKYGEGTGAWSYLASSGGDVFFHNDSYYPFQVKVDEKISFSDCRAVPARRASLVLVLRSPQIESVV
jgi:eukaryotic-like serine/threonine-protein kinase